jgi:hypothetical protein
MTTQGSEHVVFFSIVHIGRFDETGICVQQQDYGGKRMYEIFTIKKKKMVYLLALRGLATTARARDCQ